MRTVLRSSVLSLILFTACSDDTEPASSAVETDAETDDVATDDADTDAAEAEETELDSESEE